MSDPSLDPAARRLPRDGAGWNALSWVATVAGVISVTMTLAQALIVAAGIPKGAFWRRGSGSADSRSPWRRS